MSSLTKGRGEGGEEREEKPTVRLTFSSQRLDFFHQDPSLKSPENDEEDVLFDDKAQSR